MAVITIPEGCYAQPNDTEDRDENNAKSYSQDIMGPIETIRTLVRGIVTGTDTFDGKIVKATRIRRNAANLATATLTLADSDTVVGETTNAFKAVWSFHAARNDVSILIYCSSNERVHVELWQKETDGALASAYKYKDANGVHELTQREKDVAVKICNGIESVVRFYPILTLTSYYHSCPNNWGLDLGYIRTPEAAAADKVVAPSNINSVIDGFEWLKVQDDVDELPDGDFKRVQSWWGIAEIDGGWDADLYGDERWQVGSTGER